MLYTHTLAHLNRIFSKPWLCLLVCLGYLFLSSCASQPAGAGKSSKSSAFSHKQQTVVIIPVFSLVKDFRPMSKGIKAELMKQLEANHFDCYVLNDKVFTTINRKALEQSGAIYNPKVGEFVPTNRDVYIKSLVKQLGSIGEFNLLLMPEITMRQAKISGDEVWWDNQSMPLPVTGKNKSSYKVPQEGRGLSLKLSAYTSSGGQQMVSYGAIAVPFYLDISPPTPEFKMRKKVMQISDFSHAVSQAIKPLLAP